MNLRKNRLLVIGSIPPPIGGVTIHVKRLLEELGKSRISFCFMSLHKVKVRSLFSQLMSHSLIHLHSSSVYFRFYMSIFCLLFKKTLIITYHGNIGRYNWFKNFIDLLSLRLSDIPIVLNESSLVVADKVNRRTCLISAFIPPSTITQLDEETTNKISVLKNNYRTVFCTNAFNVTYDKNGHETYQILSLIALFRDLSAGLVISDPSGNYGKLIAKRNLKVSANISVISKMHDFNAVIKLADCMIRFTTTDGDSLSVKEALFAGKSVIASDVVSRHKDVILVHDLKQLKLSIEKFKASGIKFHENGYKDLELIYKKCLLNL